VQGSQSGLVISRTRRPESGKTRQMSLFSRPVAKVKRTATRTRCRLFRPFFVDLYHLKEQKGCLKLGTTPNPTLPSRGSRRRCHYAGAGVGGSDRVGWPGPRGPREYPSPSLCVDRLDQWARSAALDFFVQGRSLGRFASVVFFGKLARIIIIMSLRWGRVLPGPVASGQWSRTVVNEHGSASMKFTCGLIGGARAGARGSRTAGG
jgi:hypothetical protein